MQHIVRNIVHIAAYCVDWMIGSNTLKNKSLNKNNPLHRNNALNKNPLKNNLLNSNPLSKNKGWISFQIRNSLLHRASSMNP